MYRTKHLLFIRTRLLQDFLRNFSSALWLKQKTRKKKEVDFPLFDTNDYDDVTILTTMQHNLGKKKRVKNRSVKYKENEAHRKCNENIKKEGNLKDREVKKCTSRAISVEAIVVQLKLYLVPGVLIQSIFRSSQNLLQLFLSCSFSDDDIVPVPCVTLTNYCALDSSSYSSPPQQRWMQIPQCFFFY